MQDDHLTVHQRKKKNNNLRVMKRLFSCLTGKANEAFCFKKVFPVNPRQVPFVVESYGVGKKNREALQGVVQSLLKPGMYLQYMKSKPLIMTHDESLLPSHCFFGVITTQICILPKGTNQVCCFTVLFYINV